MSLKKKILFSLFILLFLLLLGEISARVFLHYYFSREDATVSKDKLNDYEAVIRRPAPYVAYKYPKNHKGKYITTNSLGFRGKEFLAEKKPGEKRVILFGGSTAAGFLAGGDENTILGFLRKKTESENSGDFSFYNMAVGGYISTQELVLLTVEALKYNPDIVIFLNGINDLYSSDISVPSVYPVQEKLYNDLIDNNLFTPILSYLTGFLESKSKAYYLVNWLMKRKLIYQTPPSENNITENIDNYTENLAKINKICRVFDIKPYFFFQPLLTENSKKNLFPKEILALKKYQKIDEKAYDDLFNAASQTAAANGFVIYDLRRVFYNTDEQIYYDDCHFNDTGNFIVAETMYEIIKDGIKD